jgi:hypothetical protein
MTRTFAAYNICQFTSQVLIRLASIQPANAADLRLPVGIFLLLDKKHSGDATAEEIAKRFAILNIESINFIDLYFLGWTGFTDRFGKGLFFDFMAFANCRAALRDVGITRFGGNADLILVDAYFDDQGHAALDFANAISLDLSRAVAERVFPTIGGFLQGVIEAAETIQREQKTGKLASATCAISDKLGLAFARESLLDFFLEKLGTVIGAKSLRRLAVRKVGPAVHLDSLSSVKHLHAMF